jgi:hypothetical protein
VLLPNGALDKQIRCAGSVALRDWFSSIFVDATLRKSILKQSSF